MENGTESPEPPRDEGAPDDGSASASALACNSCRRRKLKCSRELPICQQCRRAYALEKRIEDQNARDDPASVRPSAPESDDRAPGSRDPVQDKQAYDIISFFAKELRRFNEKANGSPAAGLHTNGSVTTETSRPLKRQRLSGQAAAPVASLLAPFPPLLSTERARDVVFRAYFSHVHPWIPMIHEGRLRRRLQDEDEKRKLQVVLDAIALAATRYVKDEDALAAGLQVPDLAQASMIRDHVISTAMKGLSVENLQALIVIVNNDLTDEDNGTERDSLSRPYISLAPPRDWTEAEERRRVFWNVFLLDRFCSTSMGWNTSLTSDDVHRRLPCDGITWRKEDPVVTPYLGIWDKAAGRIGNPIAFLPSHYASAPPPQAISEVAINTPSDTGASPEALSPSAIDMSSVGAFAYCIEATESLSRVTTYFLQQKANLRDPRDLSSWLTRFKELDLRLVHWKMLLPHKWKANMARQMTRMDPNLTVAHVTHNASMILLHQLMAFPPLDWSFRGRLPSLLSADTCQSAAVEIAAISENYLRFEPLAMVVSSQFAFCVFIAARVLLIGWRCHMAESEGLVPQFWSLKKTLDEMARRWAGQQEEILASTCLPAKYSRALSELHRLCREDVSFTIDVLGYTSDIEHSGELAVGYFAPRAEPTNSANTPGQIPTAPAGHLTPAPVVQSLPVQLAIGSSIQRPAMRDTNRPQRASLGAEDLGAISQMLLDQQFIDMDRVISYDDGIFGAEYDGVEWQLT
ncbi:hypothetical protein GQ53DRAFT_715239 [Thozetella sp. PMI_491]|nr:hypothetical protein GQ53DRAFT_715239 [Thozetella sp. PMI_491]